jgi:hypothetical protein
MPRRPEQNFWQPVLVEGEPRRTSPLQPPDELILLRRETKTIEELNEIEDRKEVDEINSDQDKSIARSVPNQTIASSVPDQLPTNRFSIRLLFPDITAQTLIFSVREQMPVASLR